MKASDLRNKTIDNLKEELISLYKERFNLRFQRGSGQAPKSHLLKKVKLGIARIKTILNEKGLSV